MAEGGKKMRVDDLFITEDISVLDAMRKLDETGLGVLFVAPEGVLRAVVTDGDIRRYILKSLPLEGPDHKASLDPAELAAMVRAVRNTEQALGDGRKHVTSSEAKNKAIARKSIVARRAIAAGEAFTEENLTTKRPGDGVSPMRWHEVLGLSLIHISEPTRP